MASREIIQNNLNANYDLDFFQRNVLQPVFRNSLTLVSIPEKRNINASEERLVNSIKKYGTVTLTDYRELDLYDVELASTVVIERSRVSIGTVIKKYIFGNNAVLVNFHYENQPEKSWRLSFIAKEQQIKEGEIIKGETNPKRYTYILGQNETCRTAAERFEKLSMETEFTIDKLKDAFSVEKLSKTFFDEYKNHYLAFVEHLNKRNFKASVFNGDEKSIRDFAKKLLGRIVFLYFVQKKGWLGASNSKYNDGKPDFLEELFINSGKNEAFYNNWLKKLFYDTLNNPERTDDNFKLPDGKLVKIPFLNGGLFEDDDPKGILTFPPKLFSNLFEFFKQYNFTIYEDSPDDHTIAVDPEMLGHIFENLLEDNKDKGAYYTPKEIVHYMCQESLIEYLATKLSITETVSYQQLGKEQTEMFNGANKKGQLIITQENKEKSTGITRADVEQFIKHKQLKNEIKKHCRDINKYLDEVKICDPAIGSGAFPMGLLHEIFNAKLLLNEETGVNAAEVKQNIIQNSIYGVDIENGAVDIARLRFWLSLIVDEDIPRPLPNLDYKIMQGNSLLESFGDIDLSVKTKTETNLFRDENKFSHKDIERLKKAVKNYFLPDEKTDKKNLKNEIDGIVNKFIKDLIQEKLDKVDEQIDDVQNNLMIASRSKPEPVGKKKIKEKKLKNLNGDLKQLLTEREKIIAQKSELLKIEKTGVHPYFLWHLWFHDVFQNGGFDIVIGNPPYIRQEELKPVKPILQKQGFEVYNSTSDIYTYFYEKGWQLLNNTGYLTFITSNKWMRAKYGENLRRFFKEKTALKQIIDFGGYKVFESATVDTNILLFQKGNSIRHSLENNYPIKILTIKSDFNHNTDLTAYFSHNAISMNQQDLDEKCFTFGDDAVMNLKRKIETIGTPLKDWNVRICFGIKTGFNEAFIIDTETKERLCKEDPKSIEVLKPILRGRDIKRYSYKWAGLWLIKIESGWTNNYKSKMNPERFFKNTQPAIYNHLIDMGEKKGKGKGLYQRDDQGDYWWELRDCNYYSEFEKEKLIYRDVGDKLSFAYEQGKLYGNNTVYFLNTGSKYLLALLNSLLLNFYYTKISSQLGDAASRAFTIFIEQLPIPKISESAQRPFITLVDKILTAKSQNPEADTSALERQIDEMVYKLYQLTYDEVLVIDKEFEKLMSRAEYEKLDYGFEYVQAEMKATQTKTNDKSATSLSTGTELATPPGRS